MHSTVKERNGLRESILPVELDFAARVLFANKRQTGHPTTGPGIQLIPSKRDQVTKPLVVPWLLCPMPICQPARLRYNSRSRSPERASAPTMFIPGRTTWLLSIGVILLSVVLLPSKSVAAPANNPVHAASHADWKNQPKFKPNEVMVRFRPTVSASSRLRAHASVAGQVAKSWEKLGDRRDVPRFLSPNRGIGEPTQPETSDTLFVGSITSATFIPWPESICVVTGWQSRIRQISDVGFQAGVRAVQGDLISVAIGDCLCQHSPGSNSAGVAPATLERALGKLINRTGTFCYGHRRLSSGATVPRVARVPKPPDPPELPPEVQPEG